MNVHDNFRAHVRNYCYDVIAGTISKQRAAAALYALARPWGYDAETVNAAWTEEMRKISQ